MTTEEQFEEAVRAMSAQGMTRGEVIEAVERIFDRITDEVAWSVYQSSKDESGR